MTPGMRIAMSWLAVALCLGAPAAGLGNRAELGKPAPPLELRTVEGKPFKLSDCKGRSVVLEWLNPACPHSAFAHGQGGPLPAMIPSLRAKGVTWISIVSESPDRAGGKTENIRKFVQDHGLKTPVLLDPDGKVGRTYGASSTPHLFVISGKGVLAYRGALDNAPLGKVARGEARVNHVEVALADLGSGRAVIRAETRPYGTSIRFAKR